jgi:iron complex outermembrane recepter protein
MKFETTQMAIAFASVMGLVTSNIALAQTAAPADRERVTVTGSSIKRTDLETVAPVDIVTREDIERSGKSTVAEVIKNLTADTGSSNETFVNSFAPGSAGVSLRGLGQKNTLVLINGRRAAPYGLAQNISDTFVDLNSIPTSAVDRIEVLKDGASAIYGSDAIGGVVNIILRRSFQGAEVAASLGRSSDGGLDEEKVTAAVGWGSLIDDEYNVLVTLDHYTRDGILMSQRDFSKNSDRRDRGGIWQKSTNAGTWRGAATAVPNRLAISGCPGTVITVADLANFGVNTAGLTAGGTFCSYDSASVSTLIPSTERNGMTARSTFKLSSDLTAFIDLGYSEVTSAQQSTPAFVNTTQLNNVGGFLVPSNYAVTYAQGTGGNPFTGTREVRTLFWDVGPRTNNIDTEASRFTAGLQGSHFGWDWDSAITSSKTKTNNVRTNYVSKTGLAAARAAGYSFDTPLTNTAAQTGLARAGFSTLGESTLESIDLKGSRELFELSGGAASIAIGAELRRETLEITPSNELRTGDILGVGQTIVNGARNAKAMFVELALPFTKTVEAQVALRHDRYSDYGSSTVPKAGVKWKLADNFLVRANYGKGFRAPTLPEITPSQAFAFSTLVDSAACAAGGSCSGASTSVAFSSNPRLKAEESTNINLGLVFEPTRDWSIGVDYYQIKQINVIGNDDPQSVVDRNDPTQVFRDLTNPLTGTTPTVYAIGYVAAQFVNQDYVKTSGIDLDTKVKFKTAMGSLVVSGGMSYLLKFDQPLVPGGPAYDFVGNNGPSGGYTVAPQFKAQGSLTLLQNNFSLTTTVRYIPAYDQTAGQASCNTVSTNQPNCPAILAGTASAASLPFNARLPDKVPSLTTFDLYGAYSFSKNLTGTVAVVNVFNKYPPFDPIRNTTYAYAYDLHDPRGRTVNLGMKYKF